MENTGKAAFSWAKIRNRLLKAAVYGLAAFVICRCPVMGDTFPAAIALMAYMTSRSPVNLLLIIPAAAGIVPYAFHGCDPWGELAAAAVCGLLFAVSHHLEAAPWQYALMASAVTVVCISIYRLATGTVYRIEVELLLFEGLLIFIMFFAFDVLYGSAAEWSGMQSAVPRVRQVYAKGALTASAVAVFLMAVNGAGLGFLMWPVIILLGLWMVSCIDAGEALFVTVVGAGAAALMEQEQWGLCVTVMMGLAAASAVKRYGAAAQTGVFALVCWGAGFAESGVVLGIDNYCLLLGCIFFLVMNWRFSRVMKTAACVLAGEKERERNAAYRVIKDAIRLKSAEMKELAELYSTYMDSRSVLADHFSITGQILDDLLMAFGGPLKSRRGCRDRFAVDIAVSQCAASGMINGDCCGWQDLGDGRTVMVLSDGMGKGNKAAAESLMVTRTIISLLRTGVSPEMTLKMINEIMLIKEDEDSYATVDMMIVDRRNGRTRFYKIGAAPTLIRRRDNVEEVRVSAVPLGIVNGLKIRYMETVLKKEDWIIMMSDGVSDGGNSRTAADSRAFLQYLKETAADVRSTDPEIMSRLIMERAADSYSGRERDDLTVMVARLC